MFLTMGKFGKTENLLAAAAAAAAAAVCCCCCSGCCCCFCCCSRLMNFCPCEQGKKEGVICLLKEAQCFCKWGNLEKTKSCWLLQQQLLLLQLLLSAAAVALAVAVASAVVLG